MAAAAKGPFVNHLVRIGVDHSSTERSHLDFLMA